MKETWEKPEKIEEQKKTFAVFVLLFPSLLIAVLPVYSSVIWNIAIKTLLIVFQAILIKNFADTHYGK